MYIYSLFPHLRQQIHIKYTESHVKHNSHTIRKPYKAKQPSEEKKFNKLFGTLKFPKCDRFCITKKNIAVYIHAKFLERYRGWFTIKRSHQDREEIDKSCAKIDERQNIYINSP